jgi:hypothetical protein
MRRCQEAPGARRTDHAAFCGANGQEEERSCPYGCAEEDDMMKEESGGAAEKAMAISLGSSTRMRAAAVKELRGGVRSVMERDLVGSPLAPSKIGESACRARRSGLQPRPGSDGGARRSGARHRARSGSDQEAQRSGARRRLRSDFGARRLRRKGTVLLEKGAL